MCKSAVVLSPEHELGEEKRETTFEAEMGNENVIAPRVASTYSKRFLHICTV